LKENIEMFVDKHRFSDTVLGEYLIAERSMITEVRAPGERGRSVATHGRAECSLEFYLHYAFIYVERLRRTGGVHVRVSKKTKRMSDSIIEKEPVFTRDA
jgi:hypothetical protein